MIDLVGLAALRSVARLGTLARAADALGFTPSAVSQQIKRLERDVGVDLLTPAGRGVILTPAGRAMADHAAEVSDSLERCVEAARSVAGGPPAGTVRLHAFSTAIRGLLAPVLPTLQSDFPQLRLEVTEADPAEALSAVESGTADVALIHDAEGTPLIVPRALRSRVVHTDVGDVIAARSHPLARHAGPVTAADLVGHAWVTSPPGTVCHEWFRGLAARHTTAADVRHLIDDFSTQVALVASGDVIALLPRLARPALPRGVVVLPVRRPPSREVSLTWRRSADASPAVRVLTQALAAAPP